CVSVERGHLPGLPACRLLLLSGRARGALHRLRHHEHGRGRGPCAEPVRGGGLPAPRPGREPARAAAGARRHGRRARDFPGGTSLQRGRAASLPVTRLCAHRHTAQLLPGCERARGCRGAAPAAVGPRALTAAGAHAAKSFHGPVMASVLPGLNTFTNSVEPSGEKQAPASSVCTCRRAKSYRAPCGVTPRRWLSTLRVYWSSHTIRWPFGATVRLSPKLKRVMSSDS